MDSNKDDAQGYLIEYQSLRSEIMKRQQSCDVILGVTLTTLGVILSLIFKDGDSGTAKSLDEARTLTFLAMAYLFQFGAVIFTMHHTQQMDVISRFIRTFIEPNVTGLSWETKWTLLRTRAKERLIKSKLPLGTSKYYARYYLLLTISLTLLSFQRGMFNYPGSAVIISALVCLCLLAEYFLHFRRLPGFQRWDMSWDEIKET